jgi:hypothetical protein
MTTIRPRPCPSCPYRLDVPAGIWHPVEYEKLVAYDAPIGQQPPGVFLCHTDPLKACCGWASCHRRPGCELLALRIPGQEPDAVVDTDVPLFGSGGEAAAHGLAGVEDPSPEARAMMRKIELRRAAGTRPE